MNELAILLVGFLIGVFITLVNTLAYSIYKDKNL